MIFLNFSHNFQITKKVFLESLIRNHNPWKQVPDHHSVFLRLKKLPYDFRLAHIFDPFLDQNHRLHFMVQKAQYLDQCPVKSCFPCLLCLFLLSQNLDAPHYCRCHRFFIGDWKKHWIKWLFHHQNTGRKLCIAFLNLYAKILNALQSEDFLIWVFF